jgi:hypothetical protein
LRAQSARKMSALNEKCTSGMLPIQSFAGKEVAVSTT